MCTNGTLCILSSPMTLCATVKIYPYFSSILTNEPDPILIKLFHVSAILLIATHASLYLSCIATDPNWAVIESALIVLAFI